MKTIRLFTAISAAFVIFSSCNNEKKAGEAATAFAQAVNIADTLTVKSMIQNGESLDFKEFTFNSINTPDMLLEKNEDKSYTVIFNDKDLKLVADGKEFKVTESHNVFTCSNDAIFNLLVENKFISENEENDLEAVKAINMPAFGSVYAIYLEKQVEIKKHLEDYEYAYTYYYDCYRQGMADIRYGVEALGYALNEKKVCHSLESYMTAEQKQKLEIIDKKFKAIYR